MKIQINNVYLAHAHIEELSKLNPDNDGIYTYKRLRRLENLANNTATRECNGEIEDKEAEATYTKIRRQVAKLLPDVNLIINGDPRGYSLKTNDSRISYRDWGGHKILAPEL